MKHRFCLALALIALLSQTAPAQEQRQNLLPNDSFEQADDEGNPVRWQTHVWSGRPSFEYAETGRTGKRCVAVSSTTGADGSWHATVPVEPHSIYRLSGWIKTDNLQLDRGRGAQLNLHNIQSVRTEAVTGTQDWTKVEALFDSGANDHVFVNCLFGGWGFATGKAWFDDIRLELLVLNEWEPSLAINATAVGEPVSKYIYGQFIEHLGRCIYGGIWAEMLEDRKFWYPVTPDYDPYKGTRAIAKDGPFPVVGASPWEIMGEDDSVTMVEADSFVGDHTPRVAVGSGIRQRDLGLVAGKEYVGYVWTKADGDGTTVNITLRWGEGSSNADRVTSDNSTNRYQQADFRFTAEADTTEGMLEITVTDGDPCFVGTASLMPADNVQGMRADTLDLLEQLDSPVYRWPGGNFVSGYDWRDGVGDRDRRPPRTNPAWTGVEHNDFGLDEFLVFCRLLNTEPYIAVNSGLGGVENAMAELQYANGTADSPQGQLRAKNGHAEPYDVKWWGIGNEMYGAWQLGHMSLDDYIKKHNMFADRFLAEDPSIKLVAVGDAGPWSEGMMAKAADHMDLISEHFYCQGMDGLSSHVHQIPQRIRAKADAHRGYRRDFPSLAGKDIRIAMDEWNYWYGPHLYGELGTRYFLKDGLGIAAGLNEFVRQSDMVFMANYAQTVNVIGCIKTDKTDASLATTGLVLKLYRRHFGVLPVSVSTESPLDAAAAFTSDKQKLTVAIVNPTSKRLKLPLTLEGVTLTGSGVRYEIASDDPMAYNTPGERPAVAIEEAAVEDVGDTLAVAACSVTLFVLEVE